MNDRILIFAGALLEAERNGRRQGLRACSIAVLSLLMAGCALPAAVGGRSTAQLTTPGIAALHATEIVKLLDIIRDTAIDAESLKLISTPTTRRIVEWHMVALRTIKTFPDGWRLTVLTGLQELQHSLSVSEAQMLSPYINAALLTIQAVTR